MKWFKQKTPGRKVFGFPCDQNLAEMARWMAKALKFPIFVVSEHALQIGLAEIMPLLNDKKARSDLEHHLRADHLLPHNLSQPLTDYDKRFLGERREDVIKHCIEEDKKTEDVQDAARQLIVIAKLAGIEPMHLIWFVQEVLVQNRFPKYQSSPYRTSHKNKYDLNSDKKEYEKKVFDDDAPKGG